MRIEDISDYLELGKLVKEPWKTVTSDDPATRIENLKGFLVSKGYDVDVLPHPRKENLGMFYAWKTGMGWSGPSETADGE